MVKGGPLAIVDHMEACPFQRLDTVTGLRQLIVFGQKGNGFPRENVQVRAAAVAIRAMKTFSADPDIFGLSITLLGYSTLGPQQDKVRLMVELDDVTSQVTECLTKWRYNSSVVNSVLWLRRCLGLDNVPGIPDVVRQRPPPREDGEDDDDEDDYSEIIIPDSVDAAALIVANNS